MLPMFTWRNRLRGSASHMALYYLPWTVRTFFVWDGP